MKHRIIQRCPRIGHLDLLSIAARIEYLASNISLTNWLMGFRKRLRKPIQYLFVVTLTAIFLQTPSRATDHSQFSVLHPIERIAFSNDWRQQTQRIVKQGAHIFVFFRLGSDPCGTIASNISEIRYYTAYPTQITHPSSIGSRTGTYYEALLPRTPDTCHLSHYVVAEWVPSSAKTAIFTYRNEQVRVETELREPFRLPLRPFLVGVTNAYGVTGHCGGYCPKESEIGHSYAALLSKHHIQPMQNWVEFPPVKNGLLDLDAGASERVSFRDLVVNYSIYGHIGFPRSRYYVEPIAYLKALERTIHSEGLVGHAWVYVADEPTDMEALRNELALYRRHAPSVLTMVTTPYSADLAKLVDIFAPVINHLGRRGKPRATAYHRHNLWLYASCMESCGPNRAAGPDLARRPGPDTGLPDFLIDRPASRLFSFFSDAKALGARGAFYYEATEGYRLVADSVNLLEDPWNFGGNGDGLLLYPGRPGEFGFDRHRPIPTVRLKLIRHAIENFW